MTANWKHFLLLTFMEWEISWKIPDTFSHNLECSARPVHWSKILESSGMCNLLKVSLPENGYH